jgi:hypothetical protein
MTRLTASASLVRCEISRRSNWAKRREHVRHRLTGGRGGFDGAVQRDQRPVLLLRLRHHRGDVEHRA